MSNWFMEYFGNLSDEDIVYQCRLYAISGVVIFHVFIILSVSGALLCYKKNNNAPLNDYSKDGIAQNGQPAIENTIAELGLTDKIDSIQFPRAFICPHMRKLMHNPFCNSNGITVDREPYREYLTEHRDIDPLTMKKLVDTDLFPNVVLRAQIINFFEDYAKKLAQEAANALLAQEAANALLAQEAANTSLVQQMRGAVTGMFHSFSPINNYLWHGITRLQQVVVTGTQRPGP